MITYTRWDDLHGNSRTRLSMDWPIFCTWLSELPPFAVKKTAPLIKLAIFGDKMTDKDSLRHNKNVLSIVGVEGDYDAGVVSPADALKMLESAGIRAVIVTTHSHKPCAPRYRIFAPTSKPLSPTEHYRLVARLNGALRGILAGESFTLSQSYFVGGAVGGEYMVLITFNDPDDGEYIDLLDKLDPIAIGKSSGKINDESHTGSQGKSDHDDWLADLLSGDSVHPSALRIIGRMVAQGCDDETIISVFAVFAIEIEKVRGVERAAGLRGKELEDMIASARNKGFAPEDPRAAFARLMALAGQTTVETITEFTTELANTRKAGSISRSQEDILLKPLAKRLGVTVKNLRADVFAAMGGYDEPDHLERARQVHKDIGLGSIIFTQSYFWMWNGKVWEQIDDRVVKQHTMTAIESAEQDVTKGEVDCVCDVLKTEVFKSDSTFDMASWTTINVANGTLELRDGAWYLREHRRDDFLTTLLPVEFVKDAYLVIPTRFEQFLDEVFQGDLDAAQKKQCVLEMIGYTLLATCRFEKFMMLIGKGANGKSVLLGLIEVMVGIRFVAAVQPSQFENRFQRAHLHGKLANIVTEIAQGAEIADAQLKAIVSGELTTAEHKMRPPFDFRPYATCWFGTNHLPHTRDFSDALFRRAIVLTFNNKFEGDQCDTNLKDKLIAELPGILLAALEAIAGVIKRGGFTIPASSLEITQGWRTECDQVAQFLEDVCKIDPGLSIPSSTLYCAYREWAQSAGTHALNHKNFTTRLVTNNGISSGRGNGGVRMIYGLSTVSPSYSDY